jgi:hypothetical protein
MQIGARETNPQDATFEVYGNAGNIAHFHYTGAAGATGGAIVDFSAMSGSALISGSRLGSMQFAGSYDTSLIPGIGAAINGVTTQDWSSNNLGSQLVFNTVPNNSTTRTTALILDQNQQAMFSAYTTNGFVKFTAGNGTLGVDTNSYLSTLYAGNGISITGGDTISANLVAGANVTITSGTGGDTISAASSSGITQLYAGTGISITGTDTITNTLPAPASPNTAYNQNFYTSIPLVDATPGVAGSNGVSYGDHVHPTDTSRQSALTAGQLAAITLVLAGL